MTKLERGLKHLRELWRFLVVRGSRSAGFRTCCIADFQSAGHRKHLACTTIWTVRRLEALRYSRFGNLRYFACGFPLSALCVSINLWGAHSTNASVISLPPHPRLLLNAEGV